MQKINTLLFLLFISLVSYGQNLPKPTRYNGTIKDLKCDSIRGKFYLFRPSGEQITKTQYDYINFNEDNYYTFRSDRLLKAVLNGEKIFIDTLGNIIAKDVFLDFFDFSYLGIDAIIAEKDKKYGVLSGDLKKQILPFDYNYITLIDKKYYSISLNKAVGVSDLSGNTIVPNLYTGLSLNKSFNNLFLMIKDGQKYLINNQGKTVATFGDYNIQIQKVSDRLNWIKDDPEEGLIDSSGKWIYPLGEYSIHINGPLGSIRNKNKKFGLINSKAELILPVEYDDIDLRFKGNGAFLKKKQSSTQEVNIESDSDEFVYQYVDSLGNLKINSSKKIIEYNSDSVHELYAYIPTGGYATYDLNGNPKASYPRASLPAYLWEIFYDKKTGKGGVKDQWDNIKILPQFDELPYGSFGGSAYTQIAQFGDFHKDCFMGKCKFGVIDTLGNIVVPMEYDEILVEDSNGYFITKKGNKIFFWDRNRNTTSNKMRYAEIVSFKQNDFIFERGGRYVIYHIDGTVLSPIEYDEYKYPRDKYRNSTLTTDFLFVYKGNKAGVWDTKEQKQNIPCIYEDLEFYDSCCLLGYKENNKWGVLNYTNKEVVTKAAYDAIEYLQIELLLKVCTNSLWGLVDPETGKNITPIEYQEIKEMSISNNKTLIKVRKNSLWGIIDKKGNEILPCKYDLIENPKGSILVVGEDIWCYEDAVISPK